jgi:hypothetical protein
LGQRRDIPPPPPGVEYERSVDPVPFETSDDEGFPPEPPPMMPEPVPTGPSGGSGLKTVLRGAFLLLILGPVVWGFIDGAVNGADRNDLGVIEEGGDLAVMDLQVGDCFDLPAGTESDIEIDEVEAVPCADSHENEVYVVTNYTGSESYPGEGAIWDFADQFCLTAFETFVGMSYEDSLLDFGYFYPSREGWEEEDDRGVTCVVYDYNGGMLTGSMRGAAR